MEGYLTKKPLQNHATPATTPRTRPSKLLASLLVPAPWRSRRDPLSAVDEEAGWVVLLLLLLLLLMVMGDVVVEKAV